MNGRFSTWLRAGAAALALGAMAFSGSASAATKQAGDVHIIFITHGQANDVYWSVVKNGVEAGQKVMGAKVDYHAPETFDMVQMAHLIDAAVAEKPDAIVVSIPDADALKKPIMDAKAAGIPVGVIDSGQDQVHDWGLDLWVGGGSEYDNGVHAGEIMGKAGVKHTVCVNHEVGNVSLDDRCRGFKDGLAKNGGATSDVLPASMDPTDTASRVEAYLSSHADTDAILALGPSAATPIMQRLQQMGLLGKIKMGTFDLSPEVLEAIDKGDLMFGIDSQQYLMGYLPVVFFTMKAMYGTLPTADVMTGPAFIMKGDAAKVLALSKEGIR
ncbi:MAG: sugar ABC transporter substrate-binding protein [Rhizobiales bacterium]|nr:sugar ABC transporter substrate-binding protein [Hyphomicrobiales bacterium]